MSKRQPTNLVASIHQRLLNLRQESGEEFILILTRYTLERLLYRLSKSEYGPRFILKGAMLFFAWTGQPHRPTQDLDLLGSGDASAEGIDAQFRQICRTEVEPDGMVFDADSIRVAEIREGQEYRSQRVRLVALLGTARVHVQVDVGFGDAVTPEAEEIDYPTLLDMPGPRLRVYPPETVVAEKLQAMVVLGMQNSRMKDFYDLWLISRRFSFEGPALVAAVRATFERRRTAMPGGTPTALGDAFGKDRNKAIQWTAFLKRSRLEGADLSSVVVSLRDFLAPPLTAAAAGETFDRSWKEGGSWM